MAPRSRPLAATTTALWNQRLKNIPFICIERKDGSWQVRGEAQCLLGHKIERGPCRPDGIYAGWRWDGSTLIAENDRYGFYPLFYFAGRDRVCLSPLIPRLLVEGAERTIDDAAMAVFLRLGFFLGEETPFQSIRCLPPDATFQWSPTTGLKVEGRRCIRRPAAISRESALDGYIDLFRQAIDRRPPTGDRFSFPLSGGRDSRHIFLELCQRGWHPSECVTVNVPGQTDAKIATLLAETEGVPLRLIGSTPTGTPAEVRKILETSFCSDEHTWSLGLADDLAAATECSYDGIAGDILSVSRFMSAERQRLFEAGAFGELTNQLTATIDRGITAMLSPEMQKRWSSELAASRIEAEFQQYGEAANPVPAFFFWNRTRREIALYSYGFLRNIRNVYAPFLDCDLYDHLASLPVSMLLDRKFHDDAIHRAYPKAAGVPLAGATGECMPMSASTRRFATEALTSILRAEHNAWLRTGYCSLKLLRSLVMRPRETDVSWFAAKCIYALYLEDLSVDGLPF